MRRLFGLILVGAGLAQLSWGGPIAGAVFAELSGDGAARILYDGLVPNREGLERLIASRKGSVERAARPRPHRDLGFAFLLEAERRPSEVEAHRYAAAAEAEFLAALRLSPADPAAWAMVPFAALRRGEIGRAAELLRIGLRVVPYAPEYALNRFAAVSALGDARDGVLERALVRALADAARYDLELTARYLVAQKNGEALVAPLSGDPDLAYELARTIERVRDELSRIEE